VQKSLIAKSGLLGVSKAWIYLYDEQRLLADTVGRWPIQAICFEELSTLCTPNHTQARTVARMEAECWG